ncbi:baseplate J/gp47 family protein [Kamptonema formosum]|uniref:baseplate J/gp47 family protein n=1 Tax=Kamptonema formosum TaxID=331992 RepID=UPI00034AC09A|nr:baseplate J/gp47 family protein [Oscillatoria sp. PCC 10802]
MSIQPAKIDSRTYEDIVAQTEELAKKFTDWRPIDDGQPDAGRALIRIFGRMAAGVSERLNKVPEKNFLAFLDLIGTQILPPQPARVPLTFNLVAGGAADAFVPAGTPVASPPAAGEEEEVVFETERDLVLTAAQLQAVFVREPAADKYSDCTPEATGKSDAAFPAFSGSQIVEHYLYMACDSLFTTLPKTNTVTLNIDFSQNNDINKASSLIWSSWDGLKGKEFQPSITYNSGQNNKWQVQINNLQAPARKTVSGIEAAWLRVGLKAAISSSQSWPSVNSIRIKVAVTENNLIAPDFCFSNAGTLDLSKDFYPLGEQPRFNDTFYIACQEVFAKPAAGVTVEMKVSDLPISKTGGAEIVWEAYSGSSWETLGRSSVNNSKVSGQANFSDGTQAFTKDGNITFTLPSQMQPATVSGVTNYWVRARLMKGNYQQEGGSVAPPSLQSIKLKYTYTSEEIPLTACQTYNDFAYEQMQDGKSFQPFSPTADANPALYLGFDRAFANRPVALYAGVEPPLPGEIAKANPVTAPARVVWEYASPAGWARLGVEDETDALSKNGLVRFVGPGDFTPRAEFGQSLYWLRARWESGQFLVPPRLRRVLTNTMWASQAVTVAEEILGSSDGNPGQTYRTAQVPVLLGQRLQVLEPALPSPAEQAAIEKLEGAGAIVGVQDEAGQVGGAWVVWHEVADFYGSGPRDRHYVLDRLAGEVRFGDGLQGTIPPQGRNNIRLAPYRSGGGVRGNRPALTVSELKTTVPYVDSVTNLEAAAGGAEGESLEAVKERGPKALRHRGRAVTVEDMEDLALEASTEVARVRAITPHFNPIDGLQWLPIYQINLDAPGEIKVELSSLPTNLTVEGKISGPGQSNPYASKQLNRNKPAMSYTVTEEQFSAGKEWSVTLVNLGESMQVTAKIKITYPTGSKSGEFLAAGQKTASQNNPYTRVRDAGIIELLIVPRIPTLGQPTPNLSLLECIGSYIRERCAPCVDLRVTEPDWVKVTVNATIVPVLVERADEVKDAAANALVKFLHPLTGGADGQGWAFGRRPHESDLYAILQKVEGVKYVDSLVINASQDFEKIAADRRDRFLIYSGTHQISLISPGGGA